jgi:Zn-dependent protease
MTPTRQGSFHLFRFSGIDVFLHWSWFVVALYEMQSGMGHYTSAAWNVLEYLSLFVIVLMHEFGHALACRQVGGRADQIVLWPLGGVAYVSPPPRPGATLWSIAAGPLVNVALLPLLGIALLLGERFAWNQSSPNPYAFLTAVFKINRGLLIFNLLPIYPLDGGQILQSLLWFVLGRARSLMIASIIGIIGVCGLIGLAFLAHSFWIGIVAVFILLNCWRGLMVARVLARMARAPRREGFACPQCGDAPPQGLFWTCGKCRTRFDTFETAAACPQCGEQFAVTQCFGCVRSSSMKDWIIAPPPIIREH